MRVLHILGIRYVTLHLISYESWVRVSWASARPFWSYTNELAPLQVIWPLYVRLTWQLCMFMEGWLALHRTSGLGCALEVDELASVFQAFSIWFVCALFIFDPVWLSQARRACLVELQSTTAIQILVIVTKTRTVSKVYKHQLRPKCRDPCHPCAVAARNSAVPSSSVLVARQLLD